MRREIGEELNEIDGAVCIFSMLHISPNKIPFAPILVTE
jgi:hypothetical protein